MNFGKLLRASMRPAYWPALARGVVPTLEHAPVLAGINPATVIDVGANKGQFSTFAAVRWPAARLIAFEPLSEPAQRYRAVLGTRATLHACALGARRDRMTMHVATRADSSSLLELGELQKSTFGMEESATVTVDVRRLDDVIGADAAGPALLKIDVQGYEYEVLEGLGELTARVEWVFVETSFVELYKGQRLFGDVADLLARLGYHQIREANQSVAADQKIQADILFARHAL